MSAHAHHRRRSAFTLLELILSMTVLTAIVAVLVQVMSNVQRVWRGGADDAATARIAFLALDRIAADLAATAQGPLPFDPIATTDENTDEEETADSQNSLRPPILVIAPAEGTTAPLPPQKVADDLGGESESGIAFSRVAVLCDASRPAWTDDASSLRPLRRPPRATGESEDSNTYLLRGLLRIRYDVVLKAAETNAAAAATPETIAYSLVRSIAGVRADDPFSDTHWWRSDKSPDGFGTSEVLARNVVWFGVTVPDFLGVTTNSTGVVNTEFQVFGKYSTVETDAQPLPPLVDVVLGLVSDRTLSRAESQPDEKRREAILREGLRVFTRRVQLR